MIVPEELGPGASSSPPGVLRQPELGGGFPEGTKETTSDMELPRVPGAGRWVPASPLSHAFWN